MDVLVISNPNSTSITQRNLANIIPTLRQVPDIRLLSRFTQYAGHAEELARQARVQGWDAVIAIGGDGTVSEVINGLLDDPSDDPHDQAHAVLTRRAPLLGIIPTGSANVFARSLGFAPRAGDAVEQLAEALRARHVRRVSLGTWADGDTRSASGRPIQRWFAVNVGFGLDAEVIHEMERRRAEGQSASPMNYAQVSVQMWSQGMKEGPRIAVRANGPDGQFEAQDLPLLFVSHTDPWTYLGPLPARIAPQGSMDAGFSLFSVESHRGLSPLAPLLGLVSPQARKLSARNTVTFGPAHDVSISIDGSRRFQVDGEYKGEFSRIDLRFVADAIEVLTPPSADS